MVQQELVVAQVHLVLQDLQVQVVQQEQAVAQVHLESMVLQVHLVLAVIYIEQHQQTHLL